MTKRQMFGAALLTVATIVTAAACGKGDDPSEPSRASASTVTSVPETDHTHPNPTSFTPERFCEILTPDDVAPLTDGNVTDSPSTSNFRGLPGCKWPVQNGYGWLEVDVFHPVDVDALLSIAKARYPVGGGTGYQQLSADGTGSCQALVQTPRMPKGYVLRVNMNGSNDLTNNLCTKSAPQTEKVLKALGW